MLRSKMDLRRPIPTKIPVGSSSWCRLTEWVVLILLPLPPLPSHAWTCHGQRLSPWLVKIARARKVMVTGTFAFPCLKPNTVWMFWLLVFGLNFCNSRWLPFVFHTFEVSQGRSAASRDGKVVAARVEQKLVLWNTPTQPRGNAGKWLSQSAVYQMS